MGYTLAGLLEGMENSALSVAVRQSAWLYPALEIVHLIGIVLLVGAAFLFDLRLLGFSGNLAVKDLAQHLLPWSRRGLYLIIPSGLLLFSTNAVALAADPVFHVKMIVLLIGGINAGIFHWYVFPFFADKTGSHTSGAAKAVAICSILAWLTMIACGRLLAY